jgi:hypothetical protein
MSSADSFDPTFEANEADRAEQEIPAVEGDRSDHPVDINVDVEADEYDVAEQSRTVPEHDDDRRD